MVSFQILGNTEETTNNILKKAEDFFLQKFDNKYNILQEAFNSKGYKHRSETKDKIRKSVSGEFHPMYGKKHSEEATQKIRQAHLASTKRGKEHFMSKLVKLTNVLTGNILEFESQIDAALYFNYKTTSVIRRAFKNKKLFQNIWKIEHIQKK